MGKIKTAVVKVKGMWKTPAEGKYLTLKEIAHYCLYVLGVGTMITIINYVATVSFIPYYYKIDSIHAYIIVASSSILNIFAQTFLGNMIEKTQTKWGKYKPYILFSLPLFALLILLVMWIPQFENESTRVLYAYLTCLPVLMVSTFFNNMYQTMPTIITPDAQERADLMTPVGLVFGFAPSVLQVIVGPIRAHYIGLGKEYMALRIIGIIGVALGVVCVLSILRVKERVYKRKKDAAVPEEKLSFKQAFKILRKNKPLIVLCIALILGSMREFVNQFRYLILQFRISENVQTALNLSGIPLTIIGFGATVAMVLLPIATRKLDKHKIIIIFSLIGVAANGALGLIGYENIPIGTPSLIVITLLHFLSMVTPLYLLIPVMLGEIADYQQSVSGRRLEGYLQNMLFTIPGLFTFIFMIAAGLWQRQVGFELKDYSGIAEFTQAQQAVACRWFDAVTLISAVSTLLMVIVLCFYPLSRKKHAVAVENLKLETEL